MNVSKPTQDALMALITETWTKDRMLDRMVSVLGVKFACNNMADLIHHGIAHYFTFLSDEIADRCLERYNISVLYGPTPAGTDDYQTVTDMIKKLLDNVIEFQNMFIGVTKIAFDNNDLQVFADLQKLMLYYNKVVEQVILLNDKMELYTEKRLYDMDAHIKNHFWILKTNY